MGDIMRRLKDFVWATEIKSIVENENKCKFIIEELEKIIGLKFSIDLPNGSKLTYFNVITTILLGSDYAEYRNILLELLKHYNVNERALLFHLIGVVSQIKRNLPEKIMELISYFYAGVKL